MIHLQKSLDAEAFMQSKLTMHKVSLVDIYSQSYRAITRRWRARASQKKRFTQPAECPNTLSFSWKAELQHINNVLAAPDLGESNKVEVPSNATQLSS